MKRDDQPFLLMSAVNGNFDTRIELDSENVNTIEMDFYFETGVEMDISVKEAKYVNEFMDMDM